MSADARRRAEALVTAWKQRVYPGAQLEPPERWLIEDVAAALQAAAARAEERTAEEAVVWFSRATFRMDTLEQREWIDTILSRVRVREPGGA